MTLPLLRQFRILSFLLVSGDWFSYFNPHGWTRFFRFISGPSSYLTVYNEVPLSIRSQISSGRNLLDQWKTLYKVSPLVPALHSFYFPRRLSHS
jgi:hypothetical protein